MAAEEPTPAVEHLAAPAADDSSVTVNGGGGDPAAGADLVSVGSEILADTTVDREEGEDEKEATEGEDVMKAREEGGIGASGGARGEEEDGGGWLLVKNESGESSGGVEGEVKLGEWEDQNAEIPEEKDEVVVPIESGSVCVERKAEGGEAEEEENGVLEKETAGPHGEGRERDAGEEEEMVGLGEREERSGIACEEKGRTEDEGGMFEDDESCDKEDGTGLSLKDGNDGEIVAIHVENENVHEECEEKKAEDMDNGEPDGEVAVIDASEKEEKVGFGEREGQNGNTCEEKGGIEEGGEKLEDDEFCDKEDGAGSLLEKENRHDREISLVPIENGNVHEEDKEKAEGREACKKEENGGLVMEKENVEPRGDEMEIDAGKKEDNVGLGEREEKNVKVSEEKGGIEEEGDKWEGDETFSKETGAVPCLENGHCYSEDASVEVNDAVDAKAGCAAELESAVPLEVERGEDPEAAVTVEAEQVPKIVLAGNEVQVESNDAEDLNPELSHPADSELPEAVETEATYQEELQSDVGENEKQEIAASRINTPGLLQPDVLVQVKHEPPEPGSVVIEGKDKKFHLAADAERVAESLDSENGEAGMCKVDVGDHVPVEEVKSEANLETGDGNSYLETGMDMDENVLVNHVNDIQSESDVNKSPLKSSTITSSADVDEAELIERSTSSSSEMKSEFDASNSISFQADECIKKADRKEAACDGTEPTKGIHGLTSSATDREVKRHPCFLVKVPRFSDEKLEKELQAVKEQLDEKTRSRDSILTSLKSQRAIVDEVWKKFEAARKEERVARDAMSSKRKEISIAQSMIDKMKDANSIDDIDNQIHGMEHMMQHETMQLKQEKQYINEIKKLKQRRDDLLSNLGSQSEMQKTFDQKDQIEERFRILRKELDSLKTELSLVEGRAKAAWKEADTELKCRDDLQGQFNDANYIRQEAYLHMQKLKNDIREKKKYFYMYMADKSAANDYYLSGEKEKFQIHCDTQVEKFMDLWNNDDEFRKQYIKYNEVSTLRRLRTLDGRSLGPDEEPPVLRSNVGKSSTEVSLSSSCTNTPVPISSPGTTQEKSGMLPLPEGKDVWPAPKVVQTNQSANKKLSNTTLKKTPANLPSNQEEKTEADIQKGPSEEEELARKEEELRKEKAAVELREQLKSEEREKAKEAEERKKRKAEKAQAKAEYKAQKEAEEKEKRREKKERKKTGIVGISGCVEGESSSTAETNPPEITRELEATLPIISKRSSKPSQALKKINKIQPLPLPLRNRSKRKMTTWMWVLLITLLVLALFFAGDYISSSKIILPIFGL